MNRDQVIAGAGAGLVKPAVAMEAQDFAAMQGLPEYLAAFELVMKGKLDDESKRLNKLIADWNARANLAAETKKLKVERDAFAAEQSAAASVAAEALDALREREAVIANDKAALAEQQRKLKEREQELAALVAKHESEHKASLENLKDRHAEADQTRVALAHTQQVLHQRDIALSAKEEKVKAAMARMSELVT